MDFFKEPAQHDTRPYPRICRRPPALSAQALVEFVLCIFIFFGFFLLLLQFIAIGNAKLRLNLATYYAARQAGLTQDEKKIWRAAKAYWPHYSDAAENLTVEYEAPDDKARLGTEATVTVTGYYYLIPVKVARSVFKRDVEGHPGAIALVSRSVAVTEGTGGAEEEEE